MVESNNSDPVSNDNTNILMEGVQAAEQVTPQHECARKKYHAPMLLLALIGLGFAGTQVWANKGAWEEVITGKIPGSSSACSLSTGHSCCSSMAKAEAGGCCHGNTVNVVATSDEAGTCPSGGCPLTAMKNMLVQQQSEEGSCCSSKKNALAQALLKAHDKTEPSTTELVMNTPVDTQVTISSMPAPEMPE